MALYALRARMMLLARRRVDGISDTIVYTTGLMEKLAVALSKSTSVPAAHASAVLGCEWIPRKPMMLLLLGVGLVYGHVFLITRGVCVFGLGELRTKALWDSGLLLAGEWYTYALIKLVGNGGGDIRDMSR